MRVVEVYSAIERVIYLNLYGRFSRRSNVVEKNEYANSITIRFNDADLLILETALEEAHEAFRTTDFYKSNPELWEASYDEKYEVIVKARRALALESEASLLRMILED